MESANGITRQQAEDEMQLFEESLYRCAAAGWKTSGADA